mmetsp:Transcript_507/g.1018  ORF Transcript_507/g.1018 Transcript_507/m.1018 type:complete len:412 (-) Transcript_507:90-1325(-)|eukprot:CAMPEP_0183741570 /NCGR_PEP_ID=MMETSP0737-20130205/62489_1 /TAXON_ID=385413 /ORGANISM="Thalassiosira miniscula, Strain CCMP1093" /LENGTH=411 /DNA_ID=CAMNT_0025976943 /DNA_START=319 /DNA_END=1554 /DNA_ORIENTATION=+
MASTTTSPALVGGILTTSQFRDSLTRHIDATKPDPLAKAQIESIRLSWEHNQPDNAKDASEQLYMGDNVEDRDNLRQFSLCGTLTLSSEYISIAIHVLRNCKIKCSNDNRITNHSSPINKGSRAHQTDTRDSDSTCNKHFQNEFYIQLTATAKIVPICQNNTNIMSSSTKEGKLDRKERAAQRKLRAEMVKRLQSDSVIRRLLVEENNGGSKNNNASTKGRDRDKLQTNDKEHQHPLCEALIQQNPIESVKSDRSLSASETSVGTPTTGGELEERVNVHEGTLEGIRMALFSHCDNNLDVLELLLNMPYFPRSTKSTTLATTMDKSISESIYTDATKHSMIMLAERAYLRLLEDAMFDACEREGEDELLDDLNISDVNHDDDNASLEEEVVGSQSKRKRKMPSKRIKQSAG